MKKLQKVTENKNITWSNNHELIMSAYDKLYEENNKVPSYNLLSKSTGLSETTIKKHAQSLTIENVNEKFKLHGERVATNLLKKIEDTGNAAEVKLYNQIVFGYREENKTIHEFSEAEAKEKIESLFLK